MSRAQTQVEKEIEKLPDELELVESHQVHQPINSDGTQKNN